MVTLIQNEQVSINNNCDIPQHLVYLCCILCIFLQEITWGIGYKLNPTDVPEIVNKLNHREQDGFVTKQMAMQPIDSNKCPIKVLVYIATETNPSYLGPAPEEEIAKQVVHSKGRSGSNIEYVLKLAEWMRYILPSVSDDHLFDIETQILKISKHY